MATKPKEGRKCHGLLMSMDYLVFLSSRWVMCVSECVWNLRGASIYESIYFNSSCKSKQSKINRVITLEMEESSFLQWLVTARRLYLRKHLPWKLPDRPADGTRASCIARSERTARTFDRLCDRLTVFVHCAAEELSGSACSDHCLANGFQYKWSQFFNCEDPPSKLFTPSSFGVSAKDSVGDIECVFVFFSLPIALRDWLTAGLLDEHTVPLRWGMWETCRVSSLRGSKRRRPIYSSCLKAVGGRATVARTNVAAALLINSRESWE